MIAGYAAFVPGLAIVYFHNRWTNGWPVLVTVMGWLSLVVGLLRMVFPTQLAAMATKIAPAAAGVFPVFAVVFLLIGGFLSFKAFGRVPALLQAPWRFRGLAALAGDAAGSPPSPAW
jgi:hypothetical protein